MDLMLSMLLTVVGTLIEGAYGMVAWNMAIPVIFEGAPTISLLQAVVISIVASAMTYGGTAYKEIVDDDILKKTMYKKTMIAVFHIKMIIVVSTIMLAILAIIIKVFY